MFGEEQSHSHGLKGINKGEKMARITYPKAVDKDVVLCETTNSAVSKHTTKMLLDESIPFSTSFYRIPFFKRGKYDGATKMYTISINRNLYGVARRCIAGLERRDRERLFLNVI